MFGLVIMTKRRWRQMLLEKDHLVIEACNTRDRYKNKLEKLESAMYGECVTGPYCVSCSNSVKVYQNQSVPYGLSAPFACGLKIPCTKFKQEIGNND